MISDAGVLAMLNAYFKDVRPSNSQSYTNAKDLKLRLYANDYTPTDTSTAGAFTEATGGGYAAIAITYNGSWTVSTVSGVSQAAYAKQTFTFSGALTTNATVYGYYITDSDGVHIASERFAQTFAPAANGDYIEVTPTIKGSNGTPT